MSWSDVIATHYRRNWNQAGQPQSFLRGPIHDLPEDFRVLAFAPTPQRQMWTYATSGMSQPCDVSPLELHLFSPEKSEQLVELLVAIAHYHRTGSTLGLGDSVNFGRPWLSGSDCSFGLISLPYLDGPALENLVVGDTTAKFYWLIPITDAEVEYKKTKGLEALEERFEAAGFDYLNPERHSVV